MDRAQGSKNPWICMQSFIYIWAMYKVSKESMVPKGLRATTSAVVPISSLPTPWGWHAASCPGQSSWLQWTVHPLLFWSFAFNCETQDNLEKTEVNVHASTEINFLGKGMPVTVSTEYCCPILMSRLKKFMSPKFYSLQCFLEADPHAETS